MKGSIKYIVVLCAGLYACGGVDGLSKDKADEEHQYSSRSYETSRMDAILLGKANLIGILTVQLSQRKTLCLYQRFIETDCT